MFDKCGDMQEELMDVPMVIYIPGMAGGAEIGSLTSNLDVVPTILEMSGLSVPAGLDGISLLALAQDRVKPCEDLMCEHYGHFAVHLEQRVLYWGQYKYVVTENSPQELYDIVQDPFEQHNLVDDTAYTKLVTELKRRLVENMCRSGDKSILQIP